MAGLVWFFGAGASASFGIPTMQQLVSDFESELKLGGSVQEIAMYEDIRKFLDQTLARPADLEAVFSVVDSILNFSPDRIGVAALYQARRLYSRDAEKFITPQTAADLTPLKAQVTVAAVLRHRFEEFVQRKCEIPDGATAKIERAYETLFNMLGSRLTGFNQTGARGKAYYGWPMFTTNYDAVLEYYWTEYFRAPLNTGFSQDSVSKMLLSNPSVFQNGGLRLFKLHGSLTWFMDPALGLTEQLVVPKSMKKWTSSKFTEQAILYPIEEKELYEEPYLTMFQYLNRELASNTNWLVIGYSFGDKIIRDIFVRNSVPSTRLVILHPHKDQVEPRLAGFRGRLGVLEKRFGPDGIEDTCGQLASSFG